MSANIKIAVVGGGIIGISSALYIAENIIGVELTVISENYTPNTTGDGSAGFFFPYLLGNIQPSVLNLWCKNTFTFLYDIYNSPDAAKHGVGLLSAYYLSEKPMEVPSYQDVFINWRRMTPKELQMFPSKYKYGAFVTTLYAECTKLLPILMKRIEAKGGKFIQRRVNNLNELADEYDIVVNCPGVMAMCLAKDRGVYPIRGQVIRVRAPWIKYAVTSEDFYILPNTNDVVLGGTHQKGNWNTTPNPKDKEKIWKGCTELIPSLQEAQIIKEWVGLRPGRDQPRVERETIQTPKKKLEVVHNYGHGGSGVTLFWGCAQYAACYVVQAMNDVKSRTKSHL